MLQFKVNDLITLKLENDKTVIYVANERFTHCKYLLLTIPIEQISSFEEIESIDEAAVRLDKSLEPQLYENNEGVENEFNQRQLVPPHVEFWAHCSNLQVWAENEYSTKLLHRNLAFPLLKKLYSSNDELAKKIFKKEIAKRLESGFPPVVEFLVLQNYLDYLNDDEFSSVIQNPKVIEALVKAGYKNEEDQYQYDGLYELIKKVKAKKKSLLKNLIGELLEFNNLELIYFLDRTNLTYELNIKELAHKLLIPEEAKAVVELQEVIPEEIGIAIAPELRGTTIFVEDRHVVELDLSYCKLHKIPIQLLKFKKLKECCLDGNLLTMLPSSIEIFKEIEYLGLSHNRISTISKKIKFLKKLKSLNLSFNLLEYLPDAIGNLNSLENIDVSNNPLKTIPESLNIDRNLKKKKIN